MKAKCVGAGQVAGYAAIQYSLEDVVAAPLPGSGLSKTTSNLAGKVEPCIFTYPNKKGEWQRRLLVRILCE